MTTVAMSSRGCRLNHSLSLIRGVVTGATGFVGHHVAEALLERGVEVMGVDSLVPYYDPPLKHTRLARLVGRESFSFEQIDVSDYDAFEAAIAALRPDVIIHLAAQAGVRYSLENPRAYAGSNLDGFLSVLEACRRHAVGHLVYASSRSEYGANAKVPFSEHHGADHPI